MRDAASPKSLFDAVAAPDKLNPRFQYLLGESAEPARRMLEDVYRTFADPDGNFVEQFQTTGFDPRFFELYLFAYFSRLGFSVTRPRPNPDFLVSRGDIEVAVEATTVNPSESGVLAAEGAKIADLDHAGIRDYQRHELALRFGSSLHSKMQKRYWELPHCSGKPFVIAIQAFHDEGSLLFTDAALQQFVYGLEHTARWARDGTLEVSAAPLEEHRVASKVVRSNFFAQPENEHLSAILFTNSGTYAKFSRMGYQTGYGNDRFSIRRRGHSYNSDPDARDPTFFAYDLDQPPFVEPWGQGLVVLHNPNCRYAVPRGLFVDAVDLFLEDGTVKSEASDLHVLNSTTLTLFLHDLKKVLPAELREQRQIAVRAVSRAEFQEGSGVSAALVDLVFEEDGWFADDTRSFYGLVARDRTDGDWAYMVFARDEHFRFKPHIWEVGVATREQACMELQAAISTLLDGPQRLFPDDEVS